MNMASTNKINLSQERTQMLAFLSARLNLRPNLVCRLAIGRSLSIKKSVKDFPVPDAKGREFLRFTLTGEFDEQYKVLIFQHEYEATGKRIAEHQYLSMFLRKHIERGLNSLYDEYQKINSPVNFLMGLVR